MGSRITLVVAVSSAGLACALVTDLGDLGGGAGICTPQATQCESPTVPQTCGSDHVWHTGAACAVACCAGACVDTASDANHCGACGKSCEGAACGAGICAPVALASGQDQPWGLAIDGAYVYWANNNAAGGVFKVPIAGGAATLVASAANATEIALGPTEIYIATQSGVFASPIDGGAQRTISASSNAFGVAIDGASIFWSDNAAQKVFKGPIAGDAGVTLASNQGDVWSIGLDDASVYWTDRSGGRVVSAPKDGGSPNVRAQNQASPIGVISDGTTIYWADNTGTQVMALSLTVQNATPIPITTTLGGPRALALDKPSPKRLYFTTENTPGVYWAPPSGGPATAVWQGVAGTDSPRDIAVDATHVYWTDNKRGVVMKLVKP